MDFLIFAATAPALFAARSPPGMLVGKGSVGRVAAGNAGAVESAVRPGISMGKQEEEMGRADFWDYC